MANGGRIQQEIDFKTNTSSLNQLKKQLNELADFRTEDLQNLDINLDKDKAEANLKEIQEAVEEVQTALNKAFNEKLGTTNLTTLNQELKKMDLSQIQAKLALAGTTGKKAFRNIATEALTTNLQLKQTNKFLENIATTMGNTLKWGVASSIMNTMSNSIQQAYGYVKELDGSLNDIRIVTGKSAEEMSKFAVKANDAAKSLGQTTTDYKEASLIYFQQGKL